jgi:hypothetical protein
MSVAERRRKLSAVPGERLAELGNLNLHQISELVHLETNLPSHLSRPSAEIDAKMDACYEIYAYDDKATFGDAEPLGRFAYTSEKGAAERTASIAAFVSNLARLRNRPALAARIDRLRAIPSRPSQDPADVQEQLFRESELDLEIDERRSLERRPAALIQVDQRRFLDAHRLSSFRSRFPNLVLPRTLRAAAEHPDKVSKEVKAECTDLTIWDLLEGLSSRWEFVASPGELLPSELFERALTIQELSDLAGSLEGKRAIDVALPIGTLRIHLGKKPGNSLDMLLEE